MSAWKRARGWTERHGWGPAPLARWIGKQRREARRGRTVEIMPSQVGPLLDELIATEEAYEAALAFYSATPAGQSALFDKARAMYVLADERRDVVRAAYRAALAAERGTT